MPNDKQMHHLPGETDADTIARLAAEVARLRHVDEACAQMNATVCRTLAVDEDNARLRALLRESRVFVQAFNERDTDTPLYSVVVNLPNSDRYLYAAHIATDTIARIDAELERK
jgi:uncharacterized protein (DUF849 family)